jgi:RHS repeat-associated protein
VRQTGRTRRTVVNVETDCFGDVVKLTDLSRDERLTVSRNLRGLPSAISQPDPSVEQNTPAVANTPALKVGLDPLGLPSGVEDVFGNRTQLTRTIYDREMRLLMENGSEIDSIYNADGDLEAATMTLPEGGQLHGRINYDQAGNTIAIEGPGGEGSIRRFVYDKAARLTKIIDSNDKEMLFEYNDYGELKRKSLANGRFAEYNRDAMGRIVTIREHDASGTVWKTTTWEYDVLGNLAVQDDGHYRTESTFDKLARILEKKMTILRVKMSETLKYTWGEYGNLMSVEDSDGYILQYTWDNEDNLVDINVTAQGLDHTVRRDYDRVGNLQGWEYRNANAPLVSAAIERDRKGRPTELRYDAPDLKGIDAEYEYDAMDRVVRADYHNNNVVRRFAYDGRGHLIGEEWRQRDGTLISDDRVEYDEAGNRVRRNRDGRLTTYQYDDLNRLVAVIADELVKLPVSSISVQADSEFSQEFEAEWAIDGRTPDSADVRTAWRSTATDEDHWIELDLGAIRPVAAIDVSFPTARGGIDRFQVEWRDPARGLVEVVRPAGVYFGARRDATTMTTRQHTIRLALSPPLLVQHLRVLIPQGGTARNPLTLSQEFDVIINEVSVFIPNTTRVVQQFDDAGFLTRSGSTIFEYDTEGRLKLMQGPGVHQSWEIGPNGLAVSETDHLTSQTRYFFNNGPNVFSEFVAPTSSAMPQPAVKHFSGFGADTHLGFASYDAAGNPAFHWQFREGPGSVAQVRSASGVLLEDTLANAWGEPVIPSISATDHPYGFAGRRRLPNGLYDFRARAYDPASGRFISRDPFGFAQGGSEYTYAGNDPVNSIDLMGLISWRQRAEAFAGVFYGAGRALYKVGEGAGTVFVGGAAKLLGADRNGYFTDVIRKHDQAIEGLSESIAALPETISNALSDPTTLATGVLDDFENAVASGDAFESGAVLGEVTMQAAMAVENAGASVGRTMNLVARARNARPFAKLPCMRGSFAAGTPVLMPGGERPIETIRPGDLVITRDDVTGAFSERPVLAIHRHDEESIIRLHFRGEGEEQTLQATAEHPFWVFERGWTAASALQEGQRMFRRHGGFLEITRVEGLEGLQQVFNLTVDGSASFFAGTAEVWVHNVTPCEMKMMINMQNRMRRDVNAAWRRNPTSAQPSDVVGVALTKFKRGSGLAPEYRAAYSAMSSLRQLDDTRGLERRFVTPRREFMRSASRKGTAESYVNSPNGRYPNHVEPKLLDYIIEHVNFDDIHSITLLIERMPCGASCGTHVLPSWFDGILIEGGRFIPLRGLQGRFVGTRSKPLDVYYRVGRRLEEW